MQQQPALTPQQEAIREVRARYERGEISFERFEYGLNALLAAQTPAECQAILEELPAASANPLDALVVQPAAPPAQPAPKLPGRSWLVLVLGELQKLKRPWRLGRHTTALMGVGELSLDLSLASMPPHSVLNVYCLIGEATLYVPSSAHVSVRALTLLGEARAFDESREGVFAYLSEEEFPAQGASSASAPRLEIRAFMLIGELTVKQVDAPVVTLREVKDQKTPPALAQPQ